MAETEDEIIIIGTRADNSDSYDFLLDYEPDLAVNADQFWSPALAGGGGGGVSASVDVGLVQMLLNLFKSEADKREDSPDYSFDSQDIESETTFLVSGSDGEAVVVQGYTMRDGTNWIDTDNDGVPDLNFAYNETTGTVWAALDGRGGTLETELSDDFTFI